MLYKAGTWSTIWELLMNIPKKRSRKKRQVMPWLPENMPSLPNGRPKLKEVQKSVIPGDRVDVKAIEKRILSSTEHLNDILTLIAVIAGSNSESIAEAATSLARIFKGLRNHGKMTLVAGLPQESPQAQIVDWLNARYADFTSSLLNLLESNDDSLQLISLTFLLRLVKDETRKNGDTVKFANHTYTQFVKVMLQNFQMHEIALTEFRDKYLNEYYDLQFYFLQNAAKYLHQTPSPVVHQNLYKILSSFISLSPLDDSIPNMFTSLPQKTSILLPSSYKAAFQSVWLAHLRHPMDTSQLRQLLLVVHKRIIPYMNKPQLLMDWLTDSYNSGGTISLLALNGLWELMQKHNLDYPEFFVKLYALFTPSLFHTRYLARFLRLSDLFLSSLYLPATLVASFVKRLSRLSLTAPPHGIVAIIPMVYNLLKRHPTCMQVIHRLDTLPGRPDPFDQDEPDPLKTGALESSIWELASLTNHYDPNVSSLAKIFSEPFTKENYNLEDFLDHSYETMLDAGLSRKVKNPPVINHEKPGENTDIISRLWEI